RSAIKAAGMTVSDRVVWGCVGGELVSSLLAVCCVTVAFCSNTLMVQDKYTGARKDLTVSPVRPGTLALGYYSATFASTLIIGLCTLGVCLLYLARVGWFLTFFDVMFLILDVFLLVLFGTAVSSCLLLPFNTQGQASAVGTVVSAGYGFICGAYMPISQFGTGLQKALSFLPGTYGTSLLRNHALRGVFAEMTDSGFPEAVVEGIKDSVDCNIYFFGTQVHQGIMYLILAGSVVVLVGIYVLLSALRAKK
ncbi:MAG: ABC transporter permease, partial [Firmicutes bacterium]|nr:ABC transporter permease [Bacillota bacterium]